MYSRDNPQLLFSWYGFEVGILPKIRTTGGKQFSLKDCVELDKRASEGTDGPGIIACVRRRCSTVQRHFPKWDTKIIGLMTYHCEAIVHINKLRDALVKAENKIQTRVKIGLNSEIPYVSLLSFSTPTKNLAVWSDLYCSKQTNVTVGHFCAGMSHEEDQLIPNSYRYLQPWEAQSMNSAHVCSEYSMKRKEANAQNRRLTLEDLKTAGIAVSLVSTACSRRIDTPSRMTKAGACVPTGSSTSSSSIISSGGRRSVKTANSGKYGVDAWGC
ncbi:pre-mRNA-splicing factor 8 [Ceratobasidium sp. 414]|nr:pre-mRNA-splicing factor 8 [Ceratobasidium sp. 414]